MWISARTAMSLAAAALLFVVLAVAAPLLPRPNLVSLPDEKPSKASKTDALTGGKFGEATGPLALPERVRAQAMVVGQLSSVPKGSAHLDATGRVGSGAAVIPDSELVKRLQTLLNDSRTVSDPRAATAEPTFVVRLVREDHKVDVMIDAVKDRVVVALDGNPVGSYGTVGLHREFSQLGDRLLTPNKP